MMKIGHNRSKLSNSVYPRHNLSRENNGASKNVFLAHNILVFI